MDLAIVVYLIGLVSSLVFIAWGAIVLLGFVYTMWSILALADGYFPERLKSAVKSSIFWVLLPSIVIVTLLPSKTDMYIMTGLVVGEKVLSSEKGNELVDKSYLYVLAKIDEAIEEQAEGESSE